MDPNSDQKYASKRRIMGIIFCIQLVILFVSFIIVQGLNRYTGFLEFLFGIQIHYHNISDYVHVDILLIITVMAHMLMVLEPMSEIWVDMKEKDEGFSFFHFWTMITYLVSACYGLRVVSEHHIVLFTSAGARTIMEFVSIIIISFKGPVNVAVMILSLCASAGFVAALVYILFLIAHHKANEVVFGLASMIMTIFMAIASVTTMDKKVKSGMRRLGVVSFIAPVSLSISSLLWVMFASMEGDIYTACSSASLWTAGIVQAFFISENYGKS